MPGRKTHEALNLLLLGVPGTEVHRVKDSTARIHGPSHRRDHVHSTLGAMTELAKRGELEWHSPVTSLLHDAFDATMSKAKHEIRRSMPRGFLREVMPAALEGMVRDGLEAANRRKRGR
ncbi:MAG: hypothetical protein ACREC5_01810 [Thermoplasmata archaeon]